MNHGKKAQDSSPVDLEAVSNVRGGQERFRLRRSSDFGKQADSFVR